MAMYGDAAALNRRDVLQLAAGRDPDSSRMRFENGMRRPSENPSVLPLTLGGVLVYIYSRRLFYKHVRPTTRGGAVR